jgi:hypothetical protein
MVGTAQPLQLDVEHEKLPASGSITTQFGTGPMSGMIAEDGSLSVSTDIRMSTFTISVKEWRSEMEGSAPPVPGTVERMSGWFVLHWREDGRPGDAFLEAQLQGLTRSNVTGGLEWMTK